MGSEGQTEWEKQNTLSMEHLIKAAIGITNAHANGTILAFVDFYMDIYMLSMYTEMSKHLKHVGLHERMNV